MQLDYSTLQQSSGITDVYCLHLYPTNVPKLLLLLFKQTKIMEKVSTKEFTESRPRIMKTKLGKYIL